MVTFLIRYLVSLYPGGSDGKESVCNARDLGSIPESGRSPGEGMWILEGGKEERLRYLFLLAPSRLTLELVIYKYL